MSAETAVAELDEIEDLDREIAKLQSDRDARAALIADLDDRANRSARRERLVGRWAIRRGLPVEGAVEELRALSPADRHLWSRDFLVADGWVDEAGSWRFNG